MTVRQATHHNAILRPCTGNRFHADKLASTRESQRLYAEKVTLLGLIKRVILCDAVFPYISKFKQHKINKLARL